MGVCRSHAVALPGLRASGTFATVTRAIVLPVLLTLLLAAVPADAQDELVPREIGGRPAEVTTSSGADLLAALDPADISDAERLAELETLLAVTGRTFDDLSFDTAVPAEGGPGGYVVALRVAGADGVVLHALTIASVRADLAEPHQEAANVGGKAVTLMSHAYAGEPPVAIYGRDDTVWLIGGTEAEVAAIVEWLP